jgi:hypothetical protein
VTIPFDHAILRDARTPRSGLILLAGLGAVVLFAAIYGRLMSYGLRRDEMMFVPPAVLLEQSRLYADFFFNQPPYSAWYFRFMEFIFGGGGLLFAARMGVFLAWVVLAAGTAGIVWALSRSALVTAFAVVGFLTSHALMSEPGMAATNNLLQLPLTVLGVGLFLVETTRAEPRFWWLVLAGACGTIAVGVKLSGVALVPPLLAAALLMPAYFTLALRVRRVLLPLLIGGVIGALPLFWYLATDPELFLAHVLRFHLGPHVAYWEAHRQIEPDLALGLIDRMRVGYGIWLEGASLAILLVLLSMGWIAFRERGARSAQADKWRQPIFFVLATLAVTGAMSLLPKPGFPQYYILPLGCLPLLAALLYRRLTEEGRKTARPMLGAATALMLVLALPWLGPGLAGAVRPSATTVAATARGGAELKRVIEANHPTGDKVATLLPIYPLEAGLPVYPEFATGQFAFRIAPFTSAKLARNYRMVAAEGIEALFDADPPAAMLLGYDTELEAPMLRYAMAHGYRRVEMAEVANRYGAGTVYLNIGKVAQ